LIQYINYLFFRHLNLPSASTRYQTGAENSWPFLYHIRKKNLVGEHDLDLVTLIFHRQQLLFPRGIKEEPLAQCWAFKWFFDQVVSPSKHQEAALRHI